MLKAKIPSGLVRASLNSNLWGQSGFSQKPSISFEAVWHSVQKWVTYLCIRKNLNRTAKINPSFIHLSSWICILVFSPPSFWWQRIFLPSGLRNLCRQTLNIKSYFQFITWLYDGFSGFLRKALRVSAIPFMLVVLCKHYYSRSPAQKAQIKCSTSVL